MIYTKGPKTPSYHKDVDKFAIAQQDDDRHSMPYLALSLP